MFLPHQLVKLTEDVLICTEHTLSQNTHYHRTHTITELGEERRGEESRGRGEVRKGEGRRGEERRGEERRGEERRD